MVQSINDVSDVLTHIAVDVPFSLKQFRSLVDQVGGQYLIDDAVLISLGELVQTVGEETKSGEDEDLICLALLQSSGNFQHAFAGGDHIINDDHILALYAGAQELMSYDGVTTVDDTGVISSLIEHSHIQT